MSRHRHKDRLYNSIISLPSTSHYPIALCVIVFNVIFQCPGRTQSNASMTCAGHIVFSHISNQLAFFFAKQIVSVQFVNPLSNY